MYLRVAKKPVNKKRDLKNTVCDTFYPLTRPYFRQNNFVGARVLQHLFLGYK